MTERKLATIEKIGSLQPIEGADKIELAKVRGWQNERYCVPFITRGCY